MKVDNDHDNTPYAPTLYHLNNKGKCINNKVKEENDHHNKNDADNTDEVAKDLTHNQHFRQIYGFTNTVANWTKKFVKEGMLNDVKNRCEAIVDKKEGNVANPLKHIIDKALFFKNTKKIS